MPDKPDGLQIVNEGISISKVHPAVNISPESLVCSRSPANLTLKRV